MLVKWAMNTLVVGMAASIVFGVFMGFYTGNDSYFWFCLPIFVFMAG